MTLRLERARGRTHRLRRNDRLPPDRVRLAEIALSALLIVPLGAGLAVARGAPPATVTVPVGAVTGGAPDGLPAELKAAAADLLESATAKGGAGYRFEIVQRSTIRAKPGGPQIEVPDPVDPHRSLGLADAYYLIGLVETGYVIPDGFSMEMRAGPGTPDATVDLAKGELLFRALVRDGTTYRDDRRGWYPTDRPPGIGLDPATVARLPGLLRNAASPAEADLAAAEGELGKRDADAARAITATGAVADIPGIVAADGAPFTELLEPVVMSFDAAGRLAGLLVTARNTNLDAYDLVVVTEITLHYDDVPVGLPEPTPVWADADKLEIVP